MATVAAFAQDRVVLQSGKAENCKVTRFVSGNFVCEMANGAINQVASYSVKEIIFGAGDEAAAALPDPATPLKGRFYSAVDDHVAVNVNGNRIFVAYGKAPSFSEETTLTVGDLILFELNSWGHGACKIAFITSDRGLVVSFQAKDLKEIAIQPVGDVKAEAVKNAKGRAIKVKHEGMKDALLPDGIKDKSEFVWGAQGNALLGGFVTKDMVSRVGK